MNTKINFPRFLKAMTRQLIPNAGSVLIMAVMLFVYNAQAAPARDDSIGPAAPSLSSNMINYQGSLSTASGTPVTGNIGLTFRLYNIQSGGTALWTEVHANANAVPANKGIFHVLLGSLTPIPTSVWANSNVYLGVQVQGDSVELSPREIVTAVPLSVVTANIVIPDASVTTPKIANGAVTTEKLPDGSITAAKLAPGATNKITLLSSPIKILDEWGGATNGRSIDISNYVPSSATGALIQISVGGGDVRMNIYTHGATEQSLSAQSTSGFTAYNQGWVKLMIHRGFYLTTSASPASICIWIIGYIE
jgi:hypothetical protein